MGTVPLTLDQRMIAAMRCVLATSALIIIYIDPSEPDRYVPLTYAVLILYTAYSGVLLYLSARPGRPLLRIPGQAYWIDVGWYLVLISLSSGTSSIFFFFFFFSILVASFHSGFRAGLLVTAVSSLSFTTLGYLTAPA